MRKIKDIIHSMRVRFRKFIAERYDNIYPDVCWCDLVPWFLYPEDYKLREIFEHRNTAGGCWKEEIRYCGKCSVTNYGRNLYNENMC